MPTATQVSEDEKLVVKLHEMFQTALDHPTWVSWRKNAEKCNKYKENEQWTPEELSELAKRHQPPTVNNQVKVTLDRMVGQFVKQRTRIGYRGRNYPQDEPTAATLTDTFLFIKQNTNLEFEERDMAEDGFTGGFGVLECYVSFNDLFQPEIKIRHADPFEIFPDPFSRRYDWNEDASYICRAKWMDVDEAQELYPNKKREIEGFYNDDTVGLLSGIDNFKRDNYIDHRQRRVRPVETWYKTKTRESILLMPNGETISPEGMKKRDLEAARKDGAKQIDRIKTKMKVGVSIAGILLEKKDSPHDHSYFPFVPYFVHRKKSGEPYSMIWTSLTMQDAINKRESKALALLTQNQAIFTQNAVRDKVELATEMAKPDGQIEITGKLGDNFMIEKNIDLAQTQFALHQEAKNDYRRITGINPDALGERSEVRSGVGIARKQQMTDIIVAPVFDNFRRTRILLARVVLEMVRQYWSEQMMFYVTDDLGAARSVSLNANADEQKRIKEGIYDVVVEDMPDITTIAQEVFGTLSQTLPAILPFGNAWAKVLIQMSDLPKKEAILEQVEAMSQPVPPEPKFNVSLDWAKLAPEERAVFGIKLGMPELAQAAMQNPTPPEQVIKAQADMEKEKGKVEAAKVKSQVDIQKAKMDLQVTAQKNEMEIAHAQQKHQVEMQKAGLQIQKEVALSQIPPRQKGGEKAANE